MGNATGSMFYTFGIILAAYLIGVGIYQVFLWIKNRKKK